LKFCIVGTVGFFINALGLELFYRLGFRPGPAAALGTEIAIISNFILNNFTTKKVPYSAQIEVTLKCNGTCPFCAIHTLPESYITRDMNTEQIKYLIDQISDLGINALSFTGGEPTLRKDISELIYHAGIEHDLINGIATNGYLMPRLFKEHKLEGLDYILLSLDYPSAELHDRKRGLKVFDKVVETKYVPCGK
jgi:MoaA/NifB/PqqE/SkfB family radical SAM enzyme